MAQKSYAVTGMTCEHCEMSVREEVGEIDGVQNIEVSFASGELIISSSTDVDDAKVFAAVEEAGYSAVRA